MQSTLFTGTDSIIEMKSCLVLFGLLFLFGLLVLLVLFRLLVVFTAFFVFRRARARARARATALSAGTVDGRETSYQSRGWCSPAPLPNTMCAAMHFHSFTHFTPRRATRPGDQGPRITCRNRYCYLNCSRARNRDFCKARRERQSQQHVRQRRRSSAFPLARGRLPQQDDA
jgi:hypothetical protein